MKKIIFLVALIAASATAVSASDWGIGGRTGSGLQVLAQRVKLDSNYWEARFGAYWANAGGAVTADFSVLHNWNVANMYDWTPQAGKWYFDLGAGLNVGGRSHYAYVGVQGVARIGLAIRRSPWRVSFDWSPSFGPGIHYYKRRTVSLGGHYPDVVMGGTYTEFNGSGLLNFGISAICRF